LRIQEINEGTKAGYSLTGALLTITVGTQSLEVDLVTAQQDTEQVVDVSLDGERKIRIGVEKWYVANVIIPPQKTHLVESDEVDENENPQFMQEILPLNVDEVSLVLWALPAFTVDNDNEGGLI